MFSFSVGIYMVRFIFMWIKYFRPEDYSGFLIKDNNIEKYHHIPITCTNIFQYLGLVNFKVPNIKIQNKGFKKISNRNLRIACSSHPWSTNLLHSTTWLIRWAIGIYSRRLQKIGCCLNTAIPEQLIISVFSGDITTKLPSK